MRLLKAVSRGMGTRVWTLFVSIACLSINTISASTDGYVNDDLSAVFMPYYPKDQLGKEVSAIKNVTRYRTLDGRKFSRVDNPYCIFYAVYNFAPEPMWQDLVQAFLKARASGVKVQMLVDAQQLNTYKIDNWNKGLKALIDAGLKYSPTQLNLTLAEQEEYELIGINTSLRGNGLMHLKTRIFKWEDQRSKKHSVVMTGSFNPEIGPAPEHGFLNNDTFMEIHDPTIINLYNDKYIAVRGNKNVINVWNDSSPLNVLFSPDPEGPQPVDKIIEWIDAETEIIFIWVFTLRNIYSKHNVSLYDSLLAAKDRGVQVVVATDENMVENSTHQLNKFLRRKGIPVYLCNNTAGEFIAMHNKNAMMGITEAHIITDTCNWTGGALSNPRWLPVAINDESILWINCTKASGYKHLGVEFTSNFLALLRSYESQAWNAGQPKVQEIVDNLADSVDAWRRVSLKFQLHANDVADFDMVNSTGYDFVLELHSVKGSGGKPWILNRDLKRIAGTNTWSTDGTEPIILPHGRTFQYRYGERGRAGERLWRQPHSHGFLVADPALPFQDDVVHRDVLSLQMTVSNQW